jgi:serine O-acetyltransferase
MILKKEKGTLMKMFRVANWLYRHKIPWLPIFICKIIRVIFSCDIHPATVIGEGTSFVHNGLGCVINPDAIIGSNCRIYQNVSIAGRRNRGCPVIGNNVLIGAGACVLGGVHICDNVQIGANAVVIKDVPASAIAVGIPAKII